MPKLLSNPSTTSRTEQSLGPNLQSRLEALEAAMGVRLNVAKRQGRHSLSNTASSSPMQISPTSTSSAATISTTTNTTTATSLTTSSRHNVPSRFGQGVQRSASSCDVENRPGPIKRLKPSLPVENTTSSSTVHAIATVKQHHPIVRRPLVSTPSVPTTTNISNHSSTAPTTTTTPRSLTSKGSILSKPRATTNYSTGSSRTINASNNANYRATMTNSPKTTARSLPKSKAALVSPPPPVRSATYPRKKNQSIFGEKFSDDILKTNLLWIDLKELDDDARTEVLIQFGSLEKFLHEQRLFVASQRQQAKLAAENRIGTNQTRRPLLIPKKDRLELL